MYYAASGSHRFADLPAVRGVGVSEGVGVVIVLGFAGLVLLSYLRDFAFTMA